MSLNPLANPKGVKLLCELCQKPAYVQCTACRVTYYCSEEHQKVDFIGIHEKICSLLIPLRTPIPMVSSDEERKHRQEQLLHRQKQMIDMTRTEGSKFLFEGAHEAAVPAALQALRFSIAVYGLSSVELVPAYLVLGEASIGLGRLTQAEEYLSQARWTVLKTPGCDASIKSKMYRICGLLQAAKGNFPEALKNYSNDHTPSYFTSTPPNYTIVQIYHAAVDNGPRHVKTSGGYFHMANVFFRKGQTDIAHNIYTEVVSIWNKLLKEAVKMEEPVPESALNSFAEKVESETEALDEAQEAEAIQMLHAVYDLQQNNSSYGAHNMVILLHTLALLHCHLLGYPKVGSNSVSFFMIILKPPIIFVGGLLFYYVRDLN
eukprot:sb/3465745/